jgi:hypothetical protein
MPKAAEFEEKEYEIPLYIELYHQAPLWSPGQVLEARLGVDAVVSTQNPALWRQLGYSSPLRGFSVAQLGEGFSRPGRKLPDFRANLFLQVKRPVELLRRPRGVTAADLPGRKPYWRFEARERQHKVLSRLAARLKHRALVMYASPAFADLDTLYDSIEHGRLTDRSSFIRVDKLGDHRRWAYGGGGTTGVACSTPERIDEPSLLGQLEGLHARTSDEADDGDDTVPLIQLAGLVERSIQADEAEDDPRSRAVLARYRIIDDVLPGSTRVAALKTEVRTNPVVFMNAFAKVHAFSEVFGLEWFVLDDSA